MFTMVHLLYFLFFSHNFVILKMSRLYCNKFLSIITYKKNVFLWNWTFPQVKHVLLENEKSEYLSFYISHNTYYTPNQLGIISFDVVSGTYASIIHL